MALNANEVWYDGFICDINTDSIVVTTNTVGAKWEAGFLRDPDGRLVVFYA